MATRTPDHFLALVLLALVAPTTFASIPNSPPPDAGIFLDFPLTPLAAIRHPLLNELSGLVAASPGLETFWAHNDSGAQPRLFALDQHLRLRVPPWAAHKYGTGSTILRAPWPGIKVAGASLVDWEDIARINDRLFIGDVGNNGNWRRDLGFWELPEPAPAVTTVLRPLRFLHVYYPEQRAFPGKIWEWDCEAIFSDGNRLYLITKHREAGKLLSVAPGARLYRFEPETAFTETPNALTFIARHQVLEYATAADLSPDGGMLAVLSYSAIWMFPRPRHGDNWFAARPVIHRLSLLQTQQVEALAWRDDQHLLIANEDGDSFELTIDRGLLRTLFSKAQPTHSDALLPPSVPHAKNGAR